MSEAAEEEEEEGPERMFTTKGLAEGLALLNKRLTQLEGMDPNIQQLAWKEQMACNAFRPYHEIYEKKNKLTIQKNLTMFMKKHTTSLAIPSATPADDMDYPLPSTSGQ